MTFLEDYSFWIESEEKIIQWFISNGYTVERNDKTAIHDFSFSFKGRKVNVELKTRKCLSSSYPDTLIGANKMGEAWNKFYTEGEETLFLFAFDDGLYYIAPLNYLPRKEFKLQRWDRGWIDKPKGWVYFETKDLIKIIN